MVDDMEYLKNSLLDLKKELLHVFLENKAHMIIYDANAFSAIIEYLDQMLAECDAKELKPKNKRYSYIARIVIEIPPSILDPELGRRLIKVEKEYIEYPN